MVGVSGGPDSVALLHILWQLRYELGIKIIVGHFNHRLRRAAEGDEKFVIRLAAKLNVPVFCAKPKSAHPSRGSLEDWARQERFKFLIHLSRQQGAHAVALAHTQDDLAETVLMRMLRGSGLLGLRAILLEREIERVSFIRPLLSTQKRDVLRYLKTARLTYRVDRTNLKTDFFRNKIRLKLLPLLQKEYNADIRHVLANMSENVAIDYDFLKEASAGLFARIARTGRDSSVRLNIQGLGSAHPALRRMVLRLAYERLKGDLKGLVLEHILEIEDLLDNRPARSVVDLPGQVSVLKLKSFLEFKSR